MEDKTKLTYEKPSLEKLENLNVVTGISTPA